jgi:hypothetical protein
MKINTMQKEDLAEALTSLYFLMICADKYIDTRELEMGRIMRSLEHIDEKQFFTRIDEYSNRDNREVYDTCIESLERCDQKDQIRCLAWMKVIAFSDGSMATREWDLYQNICLNELQIDLNEVLAEQKRIRARING